MWLPGCVAHAREAHRVEPHQRNREAAPQLLLELREHALQRDDEDALAAAPLDQLGGEDAGFERLAEARRVGDQNARAWLLERLQRRIELVGHQVHDTAVAQVDQFVVRNTAAPVALQVQAARRCTCGLVSGTSSVFAGSRTSISSSSSVRKSADRPRTRSDTPSQVSRKPPSDVGSVRSTSHSSSRMTTREPGLGTVDGVAVGTHRSVLARGADHGSKQRQDGVPCSLIELLPGDPSKAVCERLFGGGDFALQVGALFRPRANGRFEDTAQ